MKEGKKTTAKRKVTSSSKRVVPKNQTPKMPAKQQEPPKVKKIDVEDINKDFEDVENEDRRLIVFIAIAILVIVGTVIGLLVGCEKRNNPEPEEEEKEEEEWGDDEGRKNDGKNKQKDNKSDKGYIITIGVLSGVIVILLAFIIFHFCRKKKISNDIEIRNDVKEVGLIQPKTIY